MTRRLGVRARFTLLYGLAMFCTVLFVAAGIYVFARHALVGQVDNHLRKDFATIGQYLRHDLQGLEKVADHGPILLFSVLDNSRPMLSSDDWRSEELDRAVDARVGEDGVLSVRARYERRYRVLAGNETLGDRHYRILVAHDEEPVNQNLRSLELIILFVLPLALALSLAIGYLLAGRVLAPISAITRKAEEIGAENLSERLPVGEGNDEFSRLAMVFNQAFARIEDSFERLRRFTADASHELRTPLAAIRSIGETALHAEDGKGNCREAIGSILEESDRLRQLIDALLLLSRADAGDVGGREATDLTQLVRETVEFLTVLAEEKRQTITVTSAGGAIASVNRASIRQALTNLLDNAIKFSPEGAEIAISVGVTADNWAFVAIADRGDGIPVQDITRIFDRFYRVDRGRSREKGGVGLGLAITRWAVESNGGRIEVESELNRGSVFRVIFPRS